MPASRLWTFQRPQVSQHLLRAEQYEATWDRTPSNWRKAYRWMAKRLKERIGVESKGAPIWCWHSCNGRPGAPPTVWTARALLSDFDFEQGVEMLTLNMPDDLLLLSSYSAWNEFLDFVIVNQSLPRARQLGRRMFCSPLFNHETDDIQAVTPFLRADWVERVERVTIVGRGEDETL